MPLYEYRCARCGTVFERLEKRAGRAQGVACPHCDSRKTKRLFSRFGFKSGSLVRTSGGKESCTACTPLPGQCRTCGG